MCSASPRLHNGQANRQSNLPTSMGFDDLHSGADHYHYAFQHDDEEFHVSETGERVMMVLAVSTIILAALVIGYIAIKERAEHAAAKNR